MFELLFSSGLIATLCNRSTLTDHGVKLHDVPDEYLVDTLTIAKKIAIAQGTENYNILQVWSHFSLTSPLRHLFNRLFDNPTTLEQRTHRAPGTMCLTCTKLSSGLVPLITRPLCTKFVDHVHFHVIPKPSESKEEGLGVEWPHKTPSQEELAAVHAELKNKL